MDRNRRELVVFFLILAVLGSGAFLWWRHANPEPSLCEMCERPIHRPTAFSALVDGRKIWACCPRCGLSACAGGHEAREAEATDHTTGKVVPAESCVYVVGSSLTPCCSSEVIVMGEKIPCGRCFDRCYPSAIAFSATDKALQFIKEYGGKLLPFDTLLKELRKNP